MTEDDETGPERTCVVTRSKGSPDDMVRFVAGPDGSVVPDIRCRLPGRGVWVTATEQRVAEAVRRRVFERGLKTKVAVDPLLPAVVGGLLETDALQSLAMANKAGRITAGFTKIEQAIAGGSVLVLLHASDGADDGVRKLDAAWRRHAADRPDREPPVKLFSVQQLELALGRTNVIHAALAVGPASDAFLTRCKRLARYRSSAAPEIPFKAGVVPA